MVLNFYKNGAYNTSMPKKMIGRCEDYYNYTAGYEDLAADADDDARKHTKRTRLRLKPCVPSMICPPPA